MTTLTELKLAVTKTINLGDYNSVKVEASVVISRNDDLDTPAKMREEALVEISELIAEAEKDYVPKRRRGREESY